MKVNATLSKLLIFAVGAAAGSAVTWKIVKTKYERAVKEETEAIREWYGKKKAELEDREEANVVEDEAVTINSIKDKPSMAEYAEKLKNRGYTNYSNFADSDEEGDVEDMANEAKPYVIPPEEFGMRDGYEAVSLDYYADGILTDSWGVIIEDADNVVGLDSLTHFGEYEDDSVFVRNDELMTDYEILKDSRNFSDVIDNDPYLTED